MALALKIPQPNGTRPGYWRLSRLSLDYINRVAMLTLHGYASETARTNVHAPQADLDLRATGDEFERHFGADAPGTAQEQAYRYATAAQSPRPGAPRTADGDADTSSPFDGAAKA